MKKHFLAEYVSKRIDSVRKSLKKYRKQQKQAEIHALRVNIKQLRASFYFLNNLAPDRHFSQKAFRKLYQDSGLLRETHLHLGLAKSYHYPEAVIGALKETKKNLSAQFLAQYPSYVRSTELLAIRTALPVRPPKKKELTVFFGKQISKAKSFLKHTENKKNLHLFRKKIKEIMYVYAALPASMKKTVGLNEKYLNALQVKAGKWHDTYAAISFFEQTLIGSDGKLAALQAKEAKRYSALLKNTRKFEIKIYA